MSKIDKFEPLSRQNKKKENSSKTNFVPNSFSVLKMQKERPENQLEPNINEIQRFTTREL